MRGVDPRAHEAWRSRAVLIAMALLIVISTSPVFGHHVASSAGSIMGVRDHVLGVCLVALHLILSPVHSFFHLLVLGGFLYAIADRVRASRRLGSALRSVRWTTPLEGSALDRATRSAGLRPEDVRIVEGLPSPAFTAGFFRPRIYVAHGLEALLSAEQIGAVVAHEAAHVRRRDPLRLSALRFLGCTLFYLPALRRLADDVADDAEIAADDAAAHAAACEDVPGDRAITLASALVEIARRWPSTSSAQLAVPAVGVTGTRGDDLLDRRVRRLLGEHVPVHTHVTRRSLGAAGVVLAGVWLSGVIMAHPLPAAGGSHCDHQGLSALSHLFCQGEHGVFRGQRCPHAALAPGSSATPA